MIARVPHHGSRAGVLVVCDHCAARVEFVPGAVRCGLRLLRHREGWRMRRSDTACPACVAREAAEAADLSPLLAGSLAIARAENVRRGVIAEMAVTTGDEDEDAA